MSVIKPILSAMSPVLAVNDLQVALDHYRDVLGFEVTWTWGDPASRAGVARDGFELQLAAQYGPPGTSVVYFQVPCRRLLSAVPASRGQHRTRARRPTLVDARFSGIGPQR